MGLESIDIPVILSRSQVIRLFSPIGKREDGSCFIEIGSRPLSRQIGRWFVSSVGRRPARTRWVECWYITGHTSRPRRPPQEGPGSTEVADSIAVILVTRKNGDADTIARIRGPFRGQNRVRQRVEEMNITYFLVNPLQAGDQALLFPDGWIGMAFVAPYRVEWRTPSGSIVRGGPLPYSAQPVDERVKRQAIEDQWPISSQAPKFASTDFVGWPDVVPPFLGKALSALPDGKIAIKRTSLGADRTVQYDIVDRRGVLAGVLRLAPNERIAGFGKRTVYVVATDADDLEVLRRHPWP